MASEWPLVTIDDIKAGTPSAIAMGPFGSDIKTDNFVPEGVPVIRGGNLTSGRFVDEDFVFLTEEKADQLKAANAFAGDLIFTHRGTLGQVGIIPPTARHTRYVVSQSQMKVTCDREIVDPLFLYYFFKSPQGQQKLLANTSQTGVPAIARPVTSLKAIELQLPPRVEQSTIAHILGTLDDKIELNRRMNATLEAIARTLFQSWFVNFDPVRAKSEGRGPKGVDSETAALFPNAFEDSELGPIPLGWKVGKVGDLAGLQNGFAFRSEDWQSEGVPVVKIGSVKPGIVDLKQVSYVKSEVAEAARRYQLYPADLLIGMTGYVGEVGMVPPSDNLPLLNQRVGKFVLPKQGTHCLGFLYCLTRRKEFKKLVETNAHGSAQANVSASGVLSIKTVLPPQSLRDLFDTAAQPLLNTILANVAEAGTLTELRDTILPKLTSGQIRVSDAECLVGTHS